MSYGISTNNLPMFLGSECVIEHIKTLRLKYQDIHHDVVMENGGGINTIERVKKEYQEKGWIDISNSLLNLNDLFPFIGVQNYYTVKSAAILSENIIPLKPIKFRHFNGKTQARIAYEFEAIFGDYKGYGLANTIEVFIFYRSSNITPNTGYGIHIYDENGQLKYKDGLKLLNNIRVYPVRFETNVKYFEKRFKLENNPIFNQSFGTNIAVLQTCNFIYSQCYKINNNYYYGGAILSPVLNKNGKIEFPNVSRFSIRPHRSYPNLAAGGTYIDNITSINQILVIDKPS